MDNTIHIVHEKPYYSYYVLLLLIPAMIFVFVLTIIFGNIPRQFAASTSAASTSNTKILGTQTQQKP